MPYFPTDFFATSFFGGLGTAAAPPPVIPPTPALADALSKLSILVDATSEPVLTPDDLTALVQSCATSTIWQPNTYYQFGQRVAPTVPSGFWCVVAIPGTSGATEPAWPSPAMLFGPYGGSPFGYQTAFGLGYPVIDGTVTFRNDGRAASLFDVRAAARASWLLKAARAASQVDVTLGGDRFAWSQLQKQCLEMARAFTPFSLV